MSAVTATTWTCDRCGITDDVKPGAQPTGWGRAYLTSPPQALCRRCRDAAARWLATPDPQAVS